MPRTYISTNLTERQQEFIHLLDDYEIDIFSINTIEKLLQRKITALNEILENLVNKNFLARIEKGKYCRSNFKDELVIGCFLADEGAVAYWSSLNKHGLTEQFPNTVFIQTTKPKVSKTVFGVKYQFVKIAAYKRKGIKKEGYGNHTYLITDVGKTIVDCFDLPQYSGGYPELIRAFSEAKLQSDKMITYCEANSNIAATKRMGLLAELFHKEELADFIKYAKERINPKYNLFDPQGSESGEFIKEWKLRMNLSKSEIFEICNRQE
jgi:predicted transcriptional regulator of viral defense system